MKTFIINTLSQIPSVNKQLDYKSIIKSNEWLVFNDQSEETEKFLFLNDDKLLVSLNGKSSYAQWQYMRLNSSMLIDDGKNKYMFKIIACSKDLVFLNIDSTDSFSFLVNTKSIDLANATYKGIKWHLKKKCNIDIFNDEERKEYENDQEGLTKKKAEQKERVFHNVTKGIGIIFGLAVIFFLIVGIADNFISKKKEKEQYAKSHPLMSVTAITNRKSVDLGLSVEWATCNIGANSPFEKGNLYGWGDTSGVIYGCHTSSREYEDEPSTGGDEFLFAYPTRKDHIPPSTIVGTEYDIARQCWGGEWRMPTREEARELLDSCMFFVRKNYIVAIGPSGDSIQFLFESAIGSDMNYEYATGDLDTLTSALGIKGNKKWIHTFMIGNERRNGSAITDERGNYKIKVAMGNKQRETMLPVRAVR